MPAPRPINDPGAPVRFNRFWKGYQIGQVARFDTATAAALIDKRIAAAYRPTKAEAEEDRRLETIRRNAVEERDRLHRIAMTLAAAGNQAAFPSVQK